MSIGRIGSSTLLPYCGSLGGSLEVFGRDCVAVQVSVVPVYI